MSDRNDRRRNAPLPPGFSTAAVILAETNLTDTNPNNNIGTIQAQPDSAGQEPIVQQELGNPNDNQNDPSQEEEKESNDGLETELAVEVNNGGNSNGGNIVDLTSDTSTTTTPTRETFRYSRTISSNMKIPAKRKELVWKPFEVKIKSLTASEATVEVAKKLATDLNDNKTRRSELKSIIATLETSKVSKSMRLKQSLDLPDELKNEPEFQEKAKQIEQNARDHEIRQTLVIIETKYMMLAKVEKKKLEITLSHGYKLCKTIARNAIHRFESQHRNTVGATPPPENIPLCAVTFQALKDAMNHPDHKAKLIAFLNISGQDLETGLTELYAKVNATEKFTRIPKAQLQNMHPNFPNLIESIGQKTAVLITEASYEFNLADDNFIADMKAESENTAELQGNLNLDITRKVQFALDKEKTQETHSDNSKKTPGKGANGKLSKTQKSNLRRRERKAAAKAAARQPTQSIKETGGPKSPRSDPQNGKKNKKQGQSTNTKVAKKGSKRKPNSSTNKRSKKRPKKSKGNQDAANKDRNGNESSNG